jgi:hypothetical protein
MIDKQARLRSHRRNDGESRNPRGRGQGFDESNPYAENCRGDPCDRPPPVDGNRQGEYEIRPYATAGKETQNVASLHPHPPTIVCHRL